MEQLLILPGICLTLLLLFSGPCLAQGPQVPHVACPEYFQYLAYNREYVGRISVRHDPQYQENTVKVEFSQRGLLSSNYVGKLTLWNDEDTTKSDLRNGRPIQYRVDFPTPGVLPKLTLLMINDVVLCRGSPYPPTSVVLALSHSLRPTSMPLFTQFRQPVQQYPQPQPQRPVYEETELPQSRPQRPVYIETELPQNQSRPVTRVPPRPEPIPRPTPRPTIQARPQPAAPRTGGQGLGSLNEICGREGTITSPLIYGGTQVRRGQLPWMVALFERVADGLRFFCGGTLISAKTVLSAAHCFLYAERNLPANKAAVSLGRNTLDIVGDGELRGIVEIVIHEEYTTRTYTDADFALLRLESPVSFTQYVKPICMWNENFRLDLPSGYKMYVAGWGSDENGNANTRVAKMTDTDIVTEAQCRQDLSLHKSDGAKLVTSNTLCAGNKLAAGPCSGDSGGPLMLQENSVWLLRGVVSAGQSNSTGCDLTQPVIYTDLARHISWLRQRIWV